MDTTPLDGRQDEALDERGPEAGQGMIEYALIIILVAIGALIALQVLGHATNNLYNNIQTSLPGG
ncbi:MAG TPA: Flp family type IVb pilin [Candidatus Dormibacteraeota bacterium]|nr:Flp family type IVb pilin [Candidatus Dormibacteraeota bacterium]